MKLKQKLALSYIRARLNILGLVSPRSAAKKAIDIFRTPMRRSGKDLPALFDKGEKLSFKFEGHTVRGHRWRPHQASGPHLKRALIVHGWESSARNFEQYIQDCLKKGYEVLAFDAPAHGQSGGSKITLPLYVRVLSIVVEKYGPIDSYIAHSLGGLAVAHLLETIPAPPDARLVLIAPAVEALRAADQLFDMLRLSADVRAEFDTMGMELTGRPWAWFSIRRIMHDLRLPVLWIHDEEDNVTPLEDALPVKTDAHPNIQFLITKGLGHRKIYRDHDVIRQVMNFI